VATFSPLTFKRDKRDGTYMCRIGHIGFRIDKDDRTDPAKWNIRFMDNFGGLTYLATTTTLTEAKAWVTRIVVDGLVVELRKHGIKDEVR